MGKTIKQMLESQSEMIHCIDKNLAVVKSNVKRINGNISRHEDEIISHRKGLFNMNTRVSNIQGKNSVTGGIAGLVAGGLITLGIKFFGGK